MKLLQYYGSAKGLHFSPYFFLYSALQLSKDSMVQMMESSFTCYSKANCHWFAHSKVTPVYD